MHNKSERFCRVCGFDTGGDWVRDKYGHADLSNICECCGTHFGYDDDASADWLTYMRRFWIEKKNAAWSMPKEKPEGWSLEKQLKNISEKFISNPEPKWIEEELAKIKPDKIRKLP